jgi:hypothetical protein
VRAGRFLPAVDTPRGAAYGLLPITAHRFIGRASRLIAAGLLICGAFAGAASAVRDAGEGEGTVRLRVMTFNIFYGGDELDLRTNDW